MQPQRGVVLRVPKIMREQMVYDFTMNNRKKRKKKSISILFYFHQTEVIYFYLFMVQYFRYDFTFLGKLSLEAAK